MKYSSISHFLISNTFIILSSYSLVNASTINNQAIDTKTYTHSGIQYDTSISLGHLSGKANEYVYIPTENHTVSKLIWDIDALYMVGIGASIHYQEIVTLNTHIWFSLNDGDGKLVDYDWLIPGYDWTHQSIHNNTDITKGLMFDINLEHTTPISVSTDLSALIGYRQDSFKWKSYGGSYIYSDEDFRDESGNFPENVLGISYKQTWKVPYIGMKVNSNFGNFNLNAKVIYSPFVNAKANDTHYFRDAKGIDTFRKDSMYAIDIGLNYPINDAFTLKVNYAYEKYDTVTGDMLWKEDGQEYYLNNYAGADMKTSIISITLNYTY
jgi:plasminogen activator